MTLKILKLVEHLLTLLFSGLNPVEELQFEPDFYNAMQPMYTVCLTVSKSYTCKLYERRFLEFSLDIKNIYKFHEMI